MSAFIEKNKNELEKENLLFVEGMDDKSFFCEVFKNIKKQHLLREAIGVIDLQGDNWPSNLKATLASVKLRNKKIAIVLDSDKSSYEKVKKAFEEISANNTVLKRAIFPTEEGLFSQGEIQIGVFFIPHNLENLIFTSLDSVYINEFIEPFMNKIQEKLDATKSNWKHKHKKQVQLFMASRGDLEFAAYPSHGCQKGYFDLDHIVFDNVKKFLQEFAK